MTQPAFDPDLRVLHKDDLRELLESAAEDGARKALSAIGLTDQHAGDVRLLLALAEGIREARKEVWKTIARGICWLLVLGLVAWFVHKGGVRP